MTTFQTEEGRQGWRHAIVVITTVAGFFGAGLLYGEIATDGLPIQDGPVTFTEDDWKTYKAEILPDPFVKAVRAALDRYLRGKLPAESPAVKGIQEDGTDGLASFDRSYYKSPFVVVLVEVSPAGGKVVSILFMQKPDKMFDAWIYRTAQGRYELRGFMHDVRLSPEECREGYRALWSDRRLWM